jgi:translation elongation factor P/translation initiation factor 5A
LLYKGFGLCNLKQFQGFATGKKGRNTARTIEKNLFDGASIKTPIP